MKKSTLVNRSISKFVIDNPKVSSADIAKQFKIPVKKVYQMRSYIKRKTNESLIPKIPKVWDGKSVLKRVFVRPPELKVMYAPMTEPDKDVPTVDLVNHPPHYKVGGVETIDFIEAKGLGYNLGNVVKYLTRADHKGNKVQDLEKARWYLEREIMRQHIA